MKIISAHQPAYLPWLGYFHKMMLCDEFVIMDDVQFEKNSFINRNKILVNGQELILTIPVKTKDYTLKTIADIEIENDKWKSKHLKSVEHGYKKMPFYNESMSMIEECLRTDSIFLIDYIKSFLFQVTDYLQILVPVKFASDMQISSKKLDYVIELTKKCSGDVFVFGALGKQYADERLLGMNGIQAYFQEYKHPKYEQGNTGFHPYMSVLDCIMRYGKDALRILLQENITREQLQKKLSIV